MTLGNTNLSLSTGGIVALALGVKDWPIAQCRKSFSSLTGRAFNRRIPHRFMRSKYQSKDIMECLTETFGEESMFGGEPTNRARGCARKVAVTACTETGESAVIFANYNRRSDSESMTSSLACSMC